jgi:hypothetical protein
MNGSFAYNYKQVPPKLNGSISKVSFLQGHGFLIVISKGFVLVMEVKSNQLLGRFVKKLNPMEQVGLFFVNHLHQRISNPINNANIILICLHTICHEPLENKHT